MNLQDHQTIICVSLFLLQIIKFIDKIPVFKTVSVDHTFNS